MGASHYHIDPMGRMYLPVNTGGKPISVDSLRLAGRCPGLYYFALTGQVISCPKVQLEFGASDWL